MLKRYASHVLIHPCLGCMKQQVVELEDGRFLYAYPLTEELEDVEWLPGAIVVQPNAGSGEYLVVWHYYPFDLTTMRPVDETRRRLLR